MIQAEVMFVVVSFRLVRDRSLEDFRQAGATAKERIMCHGEDIRYGESKESKCRLLKSDAGLASAAAQIRKSLTAKGGTTPTYATADSNYTD